MESRDLQVVASFLALLGRAAGGAEPSDLAAADWAAVPATLPTIALAFVYQNVVPVIASSLEVPQKPQKPWLPHGTSSWGRGVCSDDSMARRQPFAQYPVHLTLKVVEVVVSQDT